jgi:hypothetical protein
MPRLSALNLRNRELVVCNSPAGSFPRRDACGGLSSGGTGKARSTSHGSMKREAACRLFRPERVK